DLRQWRYRQESKGNRAGKKNGDRQESGRNGTTDEGRRKIRVEVHNSVRLRGLLHWIGQVETCARATGKRVEREIHDRSGVERKQLAEQQAADDRDAQRTPQLRSGSAA